MRIHIGTDHAGFELKQYLVEQLTNDGHDVVDHGATTYDSQDDYPTFCIPAAEATVGDEGSLGIVIGGSGNGEQIAANKVTGVRAALAYNEELASLARQHNDANVVSIGARMVGRDQALAIVRTFLATSFSGDARHARRIQALADYEAAR